jgi:hypothetical protein
MKVMMNNSSANQIQKKPRHENKSFTVQQKSMDVEKLLGLIIDKQLSD